MFGTRLISSIVLLIVTVPCMLVGGSLLWVLLMAVSLIGVFELYRVLGLRGTGMEAVGYVGVLAWWALPAGYFYAEGLWAAMPVLAVFLVAQLMAFVFGYPKYRAEQLFGAVFGLIYVAVMISFIYLAREHVRLGEWLVWLIFVASWGSDTCAYALGRLIGKHKLAPVLSPKKSIEGAVAGVLGAAAIGAVFAAVMCHFTGEPLRLAGTFALIGGAGSVISQIGDLAASGIKRCYGIKDYGKLLPGHGGILDRFDSVIITAPLVYYLALWLIRL